MNNPHLTDWQQQAACTLTEAALMTADAKPNATYVTELAIICAQCPVTRQCANWALKNRPVGMYAGIWITDRGPTRQHAFYKLQQKTRTP